MHREEKSDNPNLVIVIILLVLMGIGAFVVYGGNLPWGGNQYLGSWISSDNELIHIIKADLHPPPKSTFTLSEGREATLMLQIVMRQGRSKSSYIAIDGGGIYDTDYGHAIIVWCSLHSENVLVYIRKMGGDIQLGYVRNFSSADEAFQTTHTKNMFSSPPRKWVTFKPYKP